MVRKYARTAVSTNAILIHSCGFDSIPSDLTTFLAVQRLKSSGGGNVKVGPVRSAFTAKGGASGGTIASALALLGGSSEDRAISANPYALSPIAGSHKPKPTLATWSTFNGKRTWGGFWFMVSSGFASGRPSVLPADTVPRQGPFNSAIVRRSWGILETADPSSKVLAYGPDFNYDEFLVAANPISAALTSLAFFFGFAILGELAL